MYLIILMMNEVFLLLYMVSAKNFRTGLNCKAVQLNISVEILQVLDLLAYLIGNLGSVLSLPQKFSVSKSLICLF